MQLAAGCQRQPEVGVLFSTYGERLGNLLERSPPPLAEADPAPFPDSRELLQPQPDLRAGLLQTLRLADCQLLHLVAERNSSLGKVQPPSYRFAYEVRFLRGVETCLEQPLEEEMRKWLQTLQQQKWAALPALFWNMLLQTDTIRHQLVPQGPPLEPDAQPGKVAVRQLLELLALLAGQLHQQALPDETRLDRLEALLKQARGSRYGGRLLFSLDYTNTQLQQLNPFLNAGVETVVCRPGYSRQQYEYLQNVLNKFWGGQLQPYLAMLNRQYYAIADDLATLLSLAASPKLVAYRLNYAGGRRSAAILRLRQNTLDHVKIWQRLSKRCR